MLLSLLDRLLGRREAVAAPGDPEGAVHPGTGAQATTTAPPPSPPAVPIGARRPLVSAQGSIAGYEFHLGEATLRRLRSRGDPAAASACASSLLGAMRLCAQNGQAAYGQLPASWLARVGTPHPLIRGMHLGLLDDDHAGDTALLAERIALGRSAGAAIGWRLGAVPGFASGLRADFHTLQGGGLEGAALLKALRSGAQGVPLIALDLPGIDALEAALAAGVQLACCHMDAGRQPPEVRPLTPQTQRLLALMTQLTRDAETPELVAAIKADVSLSYRLLRQLNSASVSPAGELGSIEQAVALLGRNELYRWVTVLLVQQAPARPASAALQGMALARARFFELLAEAQGEPRPGALFTMGLASMLPQLLRTRLPDALASLQLHPHAEQALLERQGPWCAYLALAEVLDESDLEEAAPLAQAFGGLPAVMAHSARAWMFATRVPTPAGD
jgi:HDOD domain